MTLPFRAFPCKQTNRLIGLSMVHHLVRIIQFHFIYRIMNQLNKENESENGNVPRIKKWTKKKKKKWELLMGILGGAENELSPSNIIIIIVISIIIIIMTTFVKGLAKNSKKTNINCYYHFIFRDRLTVFSFLFRLFNHNHYLDWASSPIAFRFLHLHHHLYLQLFSHFLTIPNDIIKSQTILSYKMAWKDITKKLFTHNSYRIICFFNEHYE